MPAFLAELYIPRTQAASTTASATRARDAAQELNRQGIQIRYLRSIFVPDDETCFQMYRAGSIQAVRDLGARAGLQFEHISEVNEEGDPSS